MKRVVAFGGGKGLSASLCALSRMAVDVTAVVTVADDGGSSGRIRSTRNVLPPGDLRKALLALARADDDTIVDVFGHRFDGQDELTGHPVGNIVLTGLMERTGDPVAALDAAARMLSVRGRVLPMACEPLDIEADIVVGEHRYVVRGQHNVAVSQGTVSQVRLDPCNARVCPEVLAAVRAADWLLFGPGSWYTSVIPHLLLPELRDAIVASPAGRIVVLNLAQEPETDGLSLPGHLAALGEYAPRMKVDAVIADNRAVGDPEPVTHAAQSLGAVLRLAPVAARDTVARHEPAALAAALRPLIDTH